MVGCGSVSHVYLRNLLRYPDVWVVACADLDVDRAKAVAEQYGIPVAGELPVVLDEPEVEIVVNLTNPVAHLEVSLAADLGISCSSFFDRELPAVASLVADLA